jgi:hypothetical protein
MKKNRKIKSTIKFKSINSSNNQGVGEYTALTEQELKIKRGKSQSAF